MAGVATETMVLSTRIMKNPITSVQSAGHGFAMVSIDIPYVCVCCVVTLWVPGGPVDARGGGIG